MIGPSFGTTCSTVAISAGRLSADYIASVAEAQQEEEARRTGAGFVPKSRIQKMYGKN
jgi:hypothetical protein